MTFLLLLCIKVSAQTDQTQINEQVWKPFVNAIMSQDVAAFMAVHSHEIIRAERNEKKVSDWKEYKKSLEEQWPAWKESLRKNKTAYTFELRFTERISNGMLAYEVGYFRNELTNFGNEPKAHYGKFQVALRKENGAWKIVVDADSNDHGTITEEQFLSAQPMN